MHILKSLTPLFEQMHFFNRPYLYARLKTRIPRKAVSHLREIERKI